MPFQLFNCTTILALLFVRVGTKRIISTSIVTKTDSTSQSIGTSDDTQGVPVRLPFTAASAVKPPSSRVGASVNIVGSQPLNCLYGEDLVKTQRGNVRIKDLIKSDEVLTFDNGGPIYTPIIMQPHTTNHHKTWGITISVAKRNVTLTPEHLIFVESVTGRHTLHASDIKLDDCLILVHSDVAPFQNCHRITQIVHNEIEGVYSPITSAGTLLVNDILVSCYSYFETHEKAHEVFRMIGGLPVGIREEIEKNIQQDLYLL